MYAIAFDLTISTLKETYSEKYHSAYVEIKNVLKTKGFTWIQGSVYILPSQPADGSLTSVYAAINALKQLPWFKESVRDIRVFRIEDYSNFTQIVKED